MRLFVLLFLFLFNSSAFAADPINWYYFGTSFRSDLLERTEEAACYTYAAYRRGSQVNIISPYCYFRVPSSSVDGGTIPVSATWQIAFLCPDKSNPINGKCSDPDPCQDKAGESVQGEELRIGVTGPKVPFPSDFCYNTCQVVGPPGNYADVYGSLNGKWTASIFGDRLKTRLYTGASCKETSDTSVDKPPEAKITTCKKTECPVQVNGVNVCVPCTSVSSDTGNDSGSTTEKTDGSKVTTESKSTTTCEGDKCTTTTTTTNTTTNSDGSDGGTETKTDSKTESKETFCKENPTFAGCVPSGFSASTCDVAPTCTGDAIQCAIVSQQQRSYCDLMATPTPISELGTNAANGLLTPLDHPLNQSETSAFNFAGAFDTSGGGGCPADVSIMDVVVPLSKTCDGLNALGIAALGISIIWAARIVFAG